MRTSYIRFCTLRSKYPKLRLNLWTPTYPSEKFTVFRCHERVIVLVMQYIAQIIEHPRTKVIAKQNISRSLARNWSVKMLIAAWNRP